MKSKVIKLEDYRKNDGPDFSQLNYLGKERFDKYIKKLDSLKFDEAVIFIQILCKIPGLEPPRLALKE